MLYPLAISLSVILLFILSSSNKTKMKLNIKNHLKSRILRTNFLKKRKISLCSTRSLRYSFW